MDYLGVTFHRQSLRDVLALFTPREGEQNEWAELPCGRNGYRAGLIRGRVRVYFEGQEGMGVHVDATGQACRQLEAEGVVTKWEGPEGFAAELRKAGGQVARIDVAFDDQAGYLRPERIEAAVAERRIVSRFNKSERRQVDNLREGSTGGWSRYFGTATSRLRVRFYDKAAEQAEKGNPVEGHWVRCEIQARDARGDWILAQLAGDGGSAAIAGLLRGYLEFKEAHETDSNRSRWETCTWWAEFLGHAAKRTLDVARVVKTLQEVATWFVRQVAPSAALLLFAREYGQEFFEKTVWPEGARRLNTWQIAALQT